MNPLIRICRRSLFGALAAACALTAHGQTPGSVTFTGTLSDITAKSGSKYWSAIWVTNATTGAFVRTLRRQGNYKSDWSKHVGTWYTLTAGDSTKYTPPALDGYTSSTATTYAAPNSPFTQTWNCKDANGNTVPDGTYRMWVQYAEDTSGQGPLTTGGILWTKGPAATSVGPLTSGSYFTNLKVDWTPATPEIAVEQPAGTGLTDGSATVNWGELGIGATPVTRTFTVRNTGNANLTGLTIKQDGTHAADFTVGPLATSIAAGGSATFTVTFSPGAAGARSAAVHIASNDANENPFDITLSGSGVFMGPPAEIAVEQPAGMDLTDGSTAATDCGCVPVGTAAGAVTFVVRNLGAAPLTGLAVTKDGDHTADFAVGPLATSVAAGTSASFTVTFTPGAAGGRSATLHLASNDADENPFDILLVGTGFEFGATPGSAELNFTLGPVWGGEHWSVVWITQADGSFIKTLDIRGNEYAGDPAAFWDDHWIDHCPAWVAARGANQVIDGFTGATAPSYDPPYNPYRVVWDGRDANGKLMPDGDYKFWVQYAEDGPPEPVTPAGLSWSKRATAGTTRPPDQGTYFTAMSIVWTPVTGYETWIATRGLPAEQRDPDRSPFGDGVTNLQKFAFNLDPGKADARRLVFGAQGAAGLPAAATGAGPRLRLEFLRRKADTNPGIAYFPEFGSGLSGWTIATGGTVTPVDATWERVVVTDPAAPGAAMRFGRVRIVHP